MADRNAHRDDLRPLLLARLATKTAQQWFDILARPGCPAVRSTPSTTVWPWPGGWAWTRW
jgi:crotonobetainyl-CoA:carnitine CoA-transferase CaiB-like acyl-CoA transferase